MRTARRFKIVTVTTGTRANAVLLSQTLVRQRLAACVNIISNIFSIYQWKGKIVKEREFLLVIKTTKEKLSGVERLVRKLHPYEVPEIISFAMSHGSKSYLAWLASSVASEKRSVQWPKK